MNYPYLRRCALAVLATLLSPFVGVAFGRGLYFTLDAFSRLLGFSPDTSPGMGAETFFAAIMSFCVTGLVLIAIWAWATDEVSS